MLKVGLTGGLASGKSHIGREMSRLGCHVAQADQMGHAILAADGEGFAATIEEFGCEILGDDGEINRKALGRIVFADPERLAALNAIVHPHVWARQQAFFREVAALDPDGIAVVEAAIMIEVGSHTRYDKLVVAWCPESVQIERFMRRDSATEADARQRLAQQMPLDKKREFADFLIDTSGTLDETNQQVQTLVEELRAVALEPAHT